MGTYRMSIDEELGVALRDGLGLKNFVETGTYKCGTTRWAAGAFANVWTVEAFEPYYQKAKAANPDLVAQGVNFIFGDSRVELPRILRKLKTPALIWLDAHWMGNKEVSDGTPGECPITEELEAIAKSKIDHVVLIDDARLFCSDANPSKHAPEQWPRLREIEAIVNRNKKHYIVIHEDMIIIAPLGKASEIVKEHMKLPSLEVLVLTSNQYAHVCQPFAHLFNKHFGDTIPARVLRYDVRPRGLPANFSNVSMGYQDNVAWSTGLRMYVDQFLSNDLILLMLEDYFITQPVNVALITALWRWMSDNPNVAKLDLSGDRLKVPYTEAEIIGGVQLIESAPDANYQASIQAAIWRRDTLRQFLIDGETPWQFEKRGTKRMIAARTDGTFSGRIMGTDPAVLHYVNAVGGEGRKPGEYDHKKIPPALWAELAGKGLVK